MIRFHQTPFFMPWLLPKVWWKKKVQEKVLYLTFDDGPIPEVTPFVLEQLQRYHAKATFFCVGENLARNKALAQKILLEGHRLANHTHQHVQAWKMKPAAYLQQVEQCQKLLEEVTGPAEGEKLFRPPHGQLTPGHLRILQPGYQVVMWSSLAYDFDATLLPEDCLRKTIAASKPGSIIVLHDSLKAERNVRYVLPRLLHHFSSLGYRFLPL